MKKITIILLLTIPILCNSQALRNDNKLSFVEELQVGYSTAQKPMGALIAGVKSGSNVIFYDQVFHFTNSVTIPFIFNFNYGRISGSWEPYIGAGYHAGHDLRWHPSLGLKKYFNKVAISAGVSGKYFTLGIGKTSHNMTGKVGDKLKISTPVLLASLGLVRGFARGLHETLINHYYRFKRVFPGANDNYWDPALSFKLKYRDFDNGDTRAAFPGSKTYMVWLTDPYHWTSAIQTVSYAGSFYFSITDIRKCDKKSLIKTAIRDILISFGSDTIGFLIVHDGLFHK